jgi:hypothetical protein
VRKSDFEPSCVNAFLVTQLFAMKDFRLMWMADTILEVVLVCAQQSVCHCWTGLIKVTTTTNLTPAGFLVELFELSISLSNVTAVSCILAIWSSQLDESFR